ncbi:MAG: PAS domain S-box protein, partial [Chloroflexi bacterium]|nr:PAS domain S-box protein [Chloroflexota bacterium]
YPEDLEQDLQVNAEAQALGRDRFQLEKRFVGKDGGVSWTRVTVSTVRDDHGAPLYSISVAEDITELKNLERQKEDFLSAVAHDLRTPLTGIKGRIQLLRRRLDGPPVEPNRLQDDLSRMEANASRMAALLNELLDVRNIQSGRALNLVRRPVDLVRLVESLVREHQPMGDRHRLVVEAQEPELVGMWDPGRLERVLANLLSNAVKYSPAGREIVLGIGHEEAPGGQPAGRWAVVTVKDEGIGIPAADLPHVFEPFHRAENVVGKIAGTGVGLAATRLIVEQHGGTIGVESREGAGTTFTLRLPLGEVVET